MQDTPDVSDQYAVGLQALKGEHRALVTITNTRRLTGSVDLDAALRDDRPHDAIWDYGIGVNHSSDDDRVVWIEVHPASSSHVDGVLAKFAWLRGWLGAEGAAFAEMHTHYVWLATGSVALPPNSPKRRLIAERGLEFRARVVNLNELGV